MTTNNTASTQYPADQFGPVIDLFQNSRFVLRLSDGVEVPVYATEITITDVDHVMLRCDVRGFLVPVFGNDR
jgi:hypothetical protein